MEWEDSFLFRNALRPNCSAWFSPPLRLGCNRLEGFESAGIRRWSLFPKAGTQFLQEVMKMKLEETKLHCQIPCLSRISEGLEKVPKRSFIKKIKFILRRRLNPQKERSLKSYTNSQIERFYRLAGWGLKGRDLSSQPAKPPSQLRAGDWVRVRSLKEIEATLNHWKQTKGCSFMPEMAKYCGTTQRVLKPMNRFVDERDLQVKKSKGIILLEGVICEGTADFGSCDRACFVFWREEWLEKIEEKPD